MYGLDLSLTRREVAFALNYVIGLALGAGGLLYMHYFAPAAGSGLLTSPVVIAAGVVTVGYVMLWRALMPFVDKVELGVPDPTLFTRGVVAFLYGAISALGVAVVLGAG